MGLTPFFEADLTCASRPSAIACRSFVHFVRNFVFDINFTAQ